MRKGRVYALRYNTRAVGGPMLVETTWSHILAGPHDRYDYRPVDYLTAHRWVREGRLHETPLYVDTYDNNRIRYARDSKW